MKKIITLFAITFCITLVNAQPIWQWAKSAGGSNTDEANAIAVDASGNTYVTGYFSSTITTIGSYTLTNSGTYSDVFIAKYNPSGTCLWAKSGKLGRSNDFGQSVCVDGNGGVYVTGGFESDTIIFGTDTLKNAHPGQNYYDVFVVKYNANGTVAWAQSMTGGWGWSISADTIAGGNVYVTGQYTPGVLVAGNYLNTGNMFVVGYEKATGTPAISYCADNDGGNGIAADGSGNVYVTGSFSGATAHFGTYTLNRVGAKDFYLVKYDNTGTVLWATSAGGSSDDVGQSVAVDANGNAFVAGYFHSASMSVGTYTLTNAGNDDAFIAKYDAGGNVLWAKCAGGSLNDRALSIATDNNGNAYVTGYVISTSITFGGYTVNNVASNDEYIFIAKYDAAGNAHWAIGAGGSTVNESRGIAADNSGNIFIAGFFYSSALFGTNTVYGGGGYAIFVAKYSQCSGFTASATTPTNVLCRGDNSGSASVTTTNGVTPFSYSWNPSGQTTQTASNLVAGNYTVTVTDDYNCSKTVATTITQPTTSVTVSIASQNNVSCHGGSNGSANATTSGGVSPYTFLWSGGQSTSAITGLSANTYTITASDSHGCAKTATVNITQPFALTVFVSVNNASCGSSDGSLIANPSGGTSPYSYQWSNGQTATTATGLATGNYTLTTMDTHTCIATQTVSVTKNPPSTPAICSITVDSLSKYNVIVWDKTSYPTTDTFFIYRDTANNNFALIGKMSYATLSQFTDTLRTPFAANGDPNASTWKYKIAVKDTCGNISVMSPYHKTLFIQNSTGNFSWNQYEVEGVNTGGGVPVPALTNYLFQRDNLSNGTWATIQTLSASSLAYTDPAYATYQSTGAWRVKTVWSISCTPTLIDPKNPEVMATTINNSKSNNLRPNNPTSVNEFALENSINIFPNPNSGQFTVYSLQSIVELSVYNIFGEKVFYKTINRKQETINLSEANGIYFAHIQTEKGTVVKKIVVAR